MSLFKQSASHHMAERILDVFKRRPFMVFFRVLVLTWAFQHRQFFYVLLFITGISLWILETIALYIDPIFADHPLLRLANTLFVLLVVAFVITELAPYTDDAVNMFRPLFS